MAQALQDELYARWLAAHPPTMVVSRGVPSEEPQ